MRRLAVLVAMGFALALAVPATALAGGPPEYEQAYVNGTTVTINAIDTNFYFLCAVVNPHAAH